MMPQTFAACVNEVVEGLPEHWLPVVGYEGLYEVSSLGAVRSVTRTVPDIRGWTRTFQGKPLVPSVSPHGYVGVGLHRNGSGRRIWIHVLVAAAFLGARPEGMQVAHGDGDRANNEVSNLRYATVAENQADRVEHRTSNRGERHGVSKLTCEQVYEVRFLLNQGETQRALADLYDVSPSQIGRIARWEQWQHPCHDCGHRWHTSWAPEVAA